MTEQAGSYANGPTHQVEYVKAHLVYPMTVEVEIGNLVRQLTEETALNLADQIYRACGKTKQEMT